MTLSQVELQLKNIKTVPRQPIGNTVEFVIKTDLDSTETKSIKEKTTEKPETEVTYNRLTNNTQLRRALWIVLFIIILLSIGLPVTLVSVNSGDASTSLSPPPPSTLPCFDQQNIDTLSVVQYCTNFTTNCVNKYESTVDSNIYPCTDGSVSCVRSILYQLC